MTNVISVDVTPGSIPADTATQATITATLTDGTDPITTPTNLTFSVNPTVGCSLSSTTADTNATDGTATVTATAFLPGDYLITVSETEDSTVTSTANLTAVSAANTINVAPAETLISPLSGAIELNATVLDSNGMPAVGVQVDWSVDSGSLFIELTSSASSTDANGVAINTATCKSEGSSGLITAKLDGGLAKASCNVFFSSPTMPAVSILNADDDHTLDAAEIALGVETYISDPNKGPYVGGDFITLYWGKGPLVVDSKQFPVDSSTQFPIPIDISTLFSPDCLLNGDYDVFYVFTNVSQNTHCSQDFKLTVNGVTPPAELPAPTFPEATNNTINANGAAGGTNMRIRYTGMAESDSVTINWQEYNSNGDPVDSSMYSSTSSITASDAKLGFHDEPIPQSNITAVKTRGTAQSSYALVRANGSTGNSATATVNIVLN